MTRYSKTLKGIRTLHNVLVDQLARETALSDITLYRRRKKALFQGVPMPVRLTIVKIARWSPEN